MYAAPCLLCKNITPWSWFPFDKLTVPQLVNNFLAFDGIQRFIAVFTALVPSLRQLNAVYVLPADVFQIHFNIILTTALVFPKWSFCRFPTKFLYELPFPRISATCPAHRTLHGPTRQDSAIWKVLRLFASMYGSYGFTVIYWYYSTVLGEFAKLRKSDITFVMSVCLSARNNSHFH